jgi:hypothetical protein
VRDPSRAHKVIAQAANALGARIRGKPITDVQVHNWDERGAFDGKTVSHPGRPVGGSEVAFPDDTVGVVAGLAKALDRNPRSFHEAALFVAGQELGIGTRALQDAYDFIYGRLRNGLWKTRKLRRRLRAPAGAFPKPLDWLTRATLFELALGEVPISYGIDAVVGFLGLPDDLTSFPPDPTALDYPEFAEMIRCVELDELRREVRKLSREELNWAILCARLLLSFAVSLARFVDLTESPIDIPGLAPDVAESARHVLRTLVFGGRTLRRLFALAGDDSEEYLAAFVAPILLVLLRRLPSRARADFSDSIRAASEALPRVLAMTALAESVQPELRRLLSFNAGQRLEEAAQDERDAVRVAALAWTETHPMEAARLMGKGLPSGDPGQ